MATRGDRTSLLCENCRNLDMDALLTRADEIFASDPTFVSEGPLQAGKALGIQIYAFDWTDASDRCQLCRFFWSMRLMDASPAQPQYLVLALPTPWSYPFVKHGHPSLTLDFCKSPGSFCIVIPSSHRDQIPWDSFQQSNFIFRTSNQRSTLMAPTILPSSVDFGLFRDWITFCSTHHKGVPCINTGRYQKVLIESQALPGFRLIDVDTKETVKPVLSQPYVALSYVWGSPQTVSRDWPRVVNDAITVTKELGYRYLWVDRYCIDQDNAAEKHAQISSMHAIYQNAELTIVAAAGSDAHHGLPGVNGKPRIAQPSISIGNLKLFSSARDVQSIIEQSTWSKRGWTYQEGVLSRRCLVFTESEVYYKCKAMFCYESIRFSLSDLHEMNNRWFRAFLKPGILDQRSNFNPYDQENYFWQYAERGLVKHILNYCKKDLTYESDRLDAFQGILRSYGYPSYYNLHLASDWRGLKHQNPVTFQGFSLGSNINNTKLQLLVALIGWSHSIDPSRNSTSGYNKPAVGREVSLPSWTWAGWKGPTSMSIWATLMDYSQDWILFQRRFDASVSLKPESLDGDVTNELLSPSSDLSSVLSQYIWIQGRHLKWRISNFSNVPVSSQADSGEVEWIFSTEYGTENSSLRFLLSVQFSDEVEFVEMLQNKDIVLVLFLNNISGMPTNGSEWKHLSRRAQVDSIYLVLQKSVISPSGETVWERIGVSFLECEGRRRPKLASEEERTTYCIG